MFRVIWSMESLSSQYVAALMRSDSVERDLMRGDVIEPTVNDSRNWQMSASRLQLFHAHKYESAPYTTRVWYSATVDGGAIVLSRSVVLHR